MTIRADVTSAGALAGLWADELSLLLYPASELEAGPAQLWLRLRGDAITAHPLTGPASGSEVGDDGAVRGEVAGVGYEAWLELLDEGYVWRYRLQARVDAVVDVLFTQDVALTPWADLRRNEYFVPQYLDLAAIETAGGTVLAVRQNMPGDANPWLALGSLARIAGWATDALQLRSATGRGLDPTRDLPSVRLQHEHTLAALQTQPIELRAGGIATGGFWGLFVRDHPEASGPADRAVIEAFVGSLDTEAKSPMSATHSQAPATLFAPLRVLDVRDPEPDDLRAWAGELTAVETGEEGFWSGFAGDGTHVVAAAKQRRVLRPHGHVAHWGTGPAATDDGLANTVWMDGVFASQLTAGNASAAPLVTLRRSYLGLAEASGCRVFVRRRGGEWVLLATPSLWLQRPLGAEWIYLTDDGTIRVRSDLTGNRTVRLEVRADSPLDLLAVVALDHPGLRVEGSDADPVDDGVLFADGRSRGLSWTGRLATDATSLALDLVVPGPEGGPVHRWDQPRLAGSSGVAELNLMLGWLTQNADVHFQAPRGLEQFTGGAWGTRDVCQGPVGLLLATGEWAALRTTLVQVFAGQAEDGDWPQWFDFLPDARPGHVDSHGDIVYWPLLALGEYLQVTGDQAILDESVRFVGDEAFTDPEPVAEHVRRALDRIRDRRTRDTRLPAYGHGDWNDSLQPARGELAQQMCSAWTSVLEIEALRTLAAGLAGSDPAWADELRGHAALTEAALREVLLVDGEMAGYAVIAPEGTDLLVHPRDTRTGLNHGSLQVIHAISAELFTPEEAAAHLALLDAELLGPSGLFLFDKPVAYHGGPMRVFKRAEAASFWGREIGLMYTHAHLRWVEALAHLGLGRRAWDELFKVLPIGLRERLPGARPAQASAYFSSADAAFDDRYQAQRQAADLFDPATPVEIGWRVYSSGPGLVLRLVVERLLGVRVRGGRVELDPVLPPDLGDVRVRLRLGGARTTFVLHPGAVGHGVTRVVVGAHETATEPLAAGRYRAAGVSVPLAQVAGREVELWTA